MLASEAGSVELLQRLVAAGADVNAARPDGTTALMTAASVGNRTVGDLLLEAGADPLAKDRHGLSAFLRTRYSEDAEGPGSVVRSEEFEILLEELIRHGVENARLAP